MQNHQLGVSGLEVVNRRAPSAQKTMPRSMKGTLLPLALVLISATAFAQTAFAQVPQLFDWPQWQGPDRNAVSKEGGLLKEWPKEGPPLAWKVTGLGGGDSAPAIAAGKIFGMSNRGEDELSEVVWALSETDGKPLWTTRLKPAHRQQVPQSKEGPAGTPTVDGERLYVMGLAGDLTCLQAQDGKLLWQRSLQNDFGAQVPTWSFRESLLVDGNKVICTPGSENATMVALNKLTGETIWKSAVPGNPRVAYSSPIAIDFEGQRQYVQFTAKGVIGVAANDGKFLWQYISPSNNNGINISTPVYQDGKVLAASAYGAGGGLAKLTKEENGGVKVEELWFSKKMQNHHGGMIIFDGAVYGANGGNGGGNLVCLDLQSGEVLWDERDNPDRRVTKGALAFADGRLYYRTEHGTMLLIEPNRKQYVEVGRFDQPDRTRQPAWAHPVIANGKLYLRDHDALFCYNVKAPGK